MVQQTVLGFKLERSEEQLTAHAGLALMPACRQTGQNTTMGWD